MENIKTPETTTAHASLPRFSSHLLPQRKAAISASLLVVALLASLFVWPIEDLSSGAQAQSEGGETTSTVPSDLVSLHHNCTDYDSESSVTGRIITTINIELIMYSTREEGDCSLSHSDGDIIVIEEVRSTCRRSTTVYSGRYDCDPQDVALNSYVVGRHPNAPVGADVYDLDFYVDSTRISGISLPGEVYSSCEYNPSGYSLSFSGRTLAVTSACVLHTDTNYVLGYSDDGQTSPLQFRNSRITNERNELFPGKWWVKLCHRDQFPNYSDHCSDIEGATQTINFEATKIGNNIYIRWHGVTSNPASRTGLPNTIYLRDRHGTIQLSCQAVRATPGNGYLNFICTGHTERLDSDFIILASDTTYAAEGGPISILQNPEIQVVRMEVTQGLQDWHNSITLVEGKRTAVRVFFEMTADVQRTFSGFLQGKKISKGSEEFLDTLISINPDNSVIIGQDVVERRHDIDSSLNFILPLDWTDLEDDEDLMLEFRHLGLDTTNVRCNDAENNRCLETVSFTSVTPPNLTFIPVSLTNELTSDPEDTLTTETNLLFEAAARIESIMPFPSQNFSDNTNYIEIFESAIGPVTQTLTRDTVGDDDLDNSNNELVEYRDELGEEHNSSIFFGLLPGPSRHSFGRASRDDDVASWFVAPSREYTYGHPRNTGAHELGHVLDRPHPVREPVIGNPPRRHGVCNSFAAEDADIYPYFHNFGTEDAEMLRPVLGPLPHENNDFDFNDEVWGLDIRYVDPLSEENFIVQNSSVVRTEITDEEYNFLSVINPYRIFSLMGYCRAFSNLENNLSQGRWIDEFNYEEILQRYATMNTDSEIIGASDDTSIVVSEYFGGWMLLSLDGSVEDISLNSVRPSFRSSVPAYASEGEYRLELRDSSGIVLLGIPFDVAEYVDDVDPDMIDEIRNTIYASFSLFVSDPPDYSKIAITRSGIDLLVVDRSPNAPTVSIDGPTEGQRFAYDDAVALSWSASDPDGDELDYKIFYSIDGGDSYRLTSTPLGSNSKSFDRLEGSERVRFAVTVSDGTRWAFTESPVFTVENSPPTVDIKSPRESAVLAGQQGFLLDGWAYDREDKSLGPSSFSWSSNIDGHLGTGSYLVLSATDLTAGDHRITLSVTDSDGLTATAATNLTINRVNQPPTANDDTARTLLDEMILLDVLANDIDVERGFKQETLAVFDLPLHGTAEIIKNRQGKSVIAYTAGSAGTDSFTYYICDGAEHCDTAQVTVTITTDGCTIVGTEEDDTIRGTSGKDVICGLGGNDIIYGSGGNDIIRAGRGDDTIYGQAGDDLIFGGYGNDNILGHRGNDTILGGFGSDQIWGGGGDDTIWGGHGVDEIRGETDDDTLYGEDGPDLIHGGRGDDTIYGGTGDDTIRGNQGADTIYPGLGKNTLLGTVPEDTIIQDFYNNQYL